MASQAKRDVIIAIDFGTTYSGFGYVFPNASEDHVYVFQKWGRGQGISYSKTPTALLLTEKGELHKFGHAAVETYGKQAMSQKDSKKLLYFEKFKLLLHSQKVGFFLLSSKRFLLVIYCTCFRPDRTKLSSLTKRKRNNVNSDRIWKLP